MKNSLLLNLESIKSVNFLESFVDTNTSAATIKDRAGRYLIANEAVARRDGISPQDYPGLTAYDIGASLHLKDKVIEKAVYLDRQISTQIQPVIRYKQILLTCNQDIIVEESIKQAIWGQSNQVIAILSYSYDVTAYVDFISLFSLYLDYYSPKKAIQFFLRYLKIDRIFYQLPTRRELEVLLTMCESDRAKYIAKKLNLSPKTIDENKARLRDKLKSITLDTLLVKLRRRHHNGNNNR